MLAELSIRGLSVIEHLSNSFSDGFSVITGESGAGKSVLVYALSLLSGERAKKEAIRKDSDRAWISATFLGFDLDRISNVLEPYGIELLDDVVTVSREMSKDRSIARINGAIVPLEALKVLSNHLILIYGQHDQLGLMEKDMALRYVDQKIPKTLLNSVKMDVLKLRDLDREERALLAPEERAREMELLSYQIDEIERADFFEANEDELFDEYKKLSHVESILESLSKIEACVDGDQEFGVEEGVEDILKTARSLEQFGFKDLIQSAESLNMALGELRYANQLAMDSLTPDPERKEELYHRITEMDAIKRKYGPEKPDVEAFYETAKARKVELEQAEDRVDAIKREREALHVKLNVNAQKLTEIRKKEAHSLSKKMTIALQELAIPHARFSVQVDAKPLDVDGEDEVEFYFSANEGEDEKLLREVASGGEMSRIMLALLTMGESVKEKTLVFDEIDTGLSGRTAQRMAEKLFDLSLETQVIAVSHLPQIASMADTHFVIEKTTEQERTYSTLTCLDEPAREREIMRLVGGVDITGATKEHAQDMLRQSMEYRERKKPHV